MSSSASAAATKSPNVVASGIGSLLRGLRLPARLRGEAGDHVQEQIREPRDEEGEEQAVVVEPLDKRRVLEDAGEAGGGSGLYEAGQHGDNADEDGDYGPPVPAAGVAVAAVVLVEVREVELAAPDDPVVHDHHRSDGPEEAAVAHEPGKDVRPGGLEEHPGERQDADDGGDDATRAERD